MNRVVITGSGVVTGVGQNLQETVEAIEANTSAIQFMNNWGKYKNLNSRVAAPVDLKDKSFIPRKSRRTMGRISLLASQAVQEALDSAGIDLSVLDVSKVGCVMGSTMGGAEALNEAFEKIFNNYDIAELTSMEFFKCVSHTVAMNIAQYLGLRGAVLAPSAACASSLQAVGSAYDLIRLGRQKVMICGGAEEVHPTVTGTFDILLATSTSYNDDPDKTPRPFDKKRDGIVCGEGAGVVILEEYEHAVARGANILAEVVGYSTCGSAKHVSQSSRTAMVQCFQEALADSKISASEVDYINAHATATIQGDIEEAVAIREVFGSDVAVSSLKGYFGHTLGASGTIELAVSLDMMKNGCIYPTRNLTDVDPDCDGILHVKERQAKSIDIMVKNCFAFGGINAVLICKKFREEK